MISRKTAATISGGMVSCMLFVAWSEFAHGTPAGEVHLITPASLAIGSTVVFTGAGYHQNAIIEAEYRAPPDSTPLPNDGLIYPTSPTRTDLRPQLATWST
jgi:hypothetical protein